MTFSGFNQNQTGNASEVGAGSVKLATQAQVDNGDADDGGVPLVITPDKFPNPNILPGLIAGEDITAGQAVSQVFAAYQDITPPLISQLTDNGTEETLGSNETRWIAQEFTTSADVSRLKELTVRIRLESGVQSVTFNIKVRETLTGPDLVSRNVTVLNGQTTNETTTNIAADLSPNTIYYVIVKINFSSGFTGWLRTTTDYAANNWLSTDSGATWNTYAMDSFVLEVIEEEETVGEDELVPSDTLSLTETGNSRINFVGFATQSVLKGAECPVDFGTVVKVAGAAFTPGETYYLTDTGGALSTTPGTYERPVGRAISTDTLIRVRGRASKYYNIGAQSRGVSNFFIMGSGSGSTTNPNVAGTTVSGCRGLAMMSKRGESFNGTSQTWVSIWDAGSPF